MKKLLFVLFITIILISTSCEFDEPDNNSALQGTMVEIDLPEGGQVLVKSTNDFSLDVFKEICVQSDGDENIFISPLSLSMALSMTCNGAAGTTLDSMLYTLRFTDFTMDELNAINKALINTLPSVDEKVELGMANSIWYSDVFPVLDDFLQVNETNYNAEVEAVDFSDPDTKNIINGWVEDETNGKIKNLIEKIDVDNIMFLINALYFNADWTIAFNEDETESGYFSLTDGNTADVEMMKMRDTIAYCSGGDFSAIELDYGQGNFSMLVILPNSRQTISQFFRDFNSEKLEECISGFSNRIVNVQLPKFKFGYKIELNDVLTAMGMGIAFKQTADFTNIYSPGGVYIDYVLQKTFIDVSEKGTEAAAATVVAMDYNSTSTGVEENIWFIADSPFVFLIREKSTEAILFAGLINEPTMEE